jgi:hypothetical protein
MHNMYDMHNMQTPFQYALNMQHPPFPYATPHFNMLNMQNM